MYCNLCKFCYSSCKSNFTANPRIYCTPPSAQRTIQRADPNAVCPIGPIGDGKDDKKIIDGKEDFMDRVKKAHYNNTTFYTHFYFFILVLMENVILTAWEDVEMGLPD